MIFLTEEALYGWRGIVSAKSSRQAPDSGLPSDSDYSAVSNRKTGHRVELPFSWQTIGLILI